MKYKLLKDLPLAKAGTEVEYFQYSNDEGAINMILESEFHKKHIADINKKDMKEWLEEVKEPKTIYDLKKGDEIWVIHGKDVIKNEAFAFAPYAHINVFLTEREAKRNKLLRELATRTDKYLPIKGEYYIDFYEYKQMFDGDKVDIFYYHMGLIFRNEQEYNKYITEEAKDLLFKI